MKRAKTVVVILALMVGGAWFFSNLSGTVDSESSRQESALRDLFKVALVQFRMDVGRFPTTAEGLSALLVCPPGLQERWRGPYIAEHGLRDPWLHPYSYRSPGIHNPTGYDLWSWGPDGRPSEDDIGNWQK